MDRAEKVTFLLLFSVKCIVLILSPASQAEADVTRTESNDSATAEQIIIENIATEATSHVAKVGWKFLLEPYTVG